MYRGAAVSVSLSLIIPGAGILGAVAVVVYGSVKRPGQTGAEAPPAIEQSLPPEWEAQFVRPIPMYTPKIIIPSRPETPAMSFDNPADQGQTAGAEMGKELVRLQERLAATSRDVQQIEQLVKDGMANIALAIDKQATAFNQSFEAAKNQFVAKAELEAYKALTAQQMSETARDLAFVRKIILTFCGFILLAFLGGVASLVITK